MFKNHHEAISIAAEAIIADLNADRQINIAKAVEVMESLKLASTQIFDRAGKIETVDYQKHRPQNPGKAIPPDSFRPVAESLSWQSFVNKEGMTVRFVNELGWKKQAEYFDRTDPEQARFCRECAKEAAHYHQRCRDVQAALGIDALNNRGQELDDLRYGIEDRLLDSRAQDFDHLVVKARLIQRFSIDAASVCAETVCLFAADVQRLLEPDPRKSNLSAAAA